MTIRIILVMAMILTTGAAVVTFARDGTPRSAARADPPMETTMKLGEFAVSRARIGEFARKLSDASGLSICAEEARLFPKKGDTDRTVGELAAKREAGVNIKLTDGTVYDVLNRLTQVDSHYTWNRDPKRGTINVYPAENAPLGWVTRALSIGNRTVRDILVTEDLLGLKDKNVVFDAGCGNLKWLETPISLESGPVRAREAMNSLCAQLGFHARWEVFELSPVKGKVIYVLMIHGMNVARPQE